MLCFCDKSRTEEEEELTVNLSLSQNPVSAEKGSQFLTITASGTWTLGAEYADGDNSAWLGFSATSGSGSTSSIVLSYTANTDTVQRQASICLVSGSLSCDLTFVQHGLESDGGSATGGYGTASTDLGWLELPATDDSDGYDFFYHDMTVGSESTRNYSFYWDYDNLLAHWVAYPLSKWNISSGSRSDAWGADPLLSTGDQPILYSGFKSGNTGSSYDRGHQIPSADRYSSTGNVQTFYFTNMTPQLGSLNQKIWAEFESQVRSWANRCDTLYVVTGCVPDGSTGYALDNNSKRVTVPVAYFKAALRYSSSSTVGHDGYLGCAVYMEHRAYSETAVTSDMSISISELEDILGYELFVNLPSVVGESTAKTIKDEDPSGVSWWW